MILSIEKWAASKGIYEEIEVKVEHYNKHPDFFAWLKNRWGDDLF